MKMIAGFISVCLSAQLFAYMDLGEHGGLYQIKEPDMMKKIKQYVSEINTTKVKSDVRKSVESAATFVNREIEFKCKQEWHTKKIDAQYAPETVYDVDGSVMLHKGDPLPVALPKGVRREYCVVDGSDEELLDQQMEFFQNESANCSYLVIDYSVTDFKERYSIKTAFPYTPTFGTRFEMECYPSKMHMYDYIIKFDYYVFEKEI